MENNTNYSSYLQDDILLGSKQCYTETINGAVCEIARHYKHKYLVGKMTLPFDLTFKTITLINDNIHGGITEIINSNTFTFDCGHIAIENCKDFSPFMPVKLEYFTPNNGYTYKNIYYVRAEMTKITLLFSKKRAKK